MVPPSFRIDLGDRPPIRLFERDGKVYTLDHRRLVAARLAGKPLRYEKVSQNEVEREWRKKYQSQNHGESVEILEKRKHRRGQKTND